MCFHCLHQMNTIHLKALADKAYAPQLSHLRAEHYFKVSSQCLASQKLPEQFLQSPQTQPSISASISRYC